MTPEAELHEQLESLYRRTGEATGYWPSYFLREVRARGGLAVAKKLLSPGQVSSGFDRLAEVHRADLSVEAIAMSSRFAHLFTDAELAEARRRLSTLPPSAFPVVLRDKVSSGDELDSESVLLEGAVKEVRVNQYERNPKARAACVRSHGTRCAVCQIDFEERYGEIGKGFIHVHHTRPLSRLKASYRVDPIKDLVPVCPNCHAMLHRREPPFDVEQLRGELESQKSDTSEALHEV